jgi:hypothetical protein
MRRFSLSFRVFTARQNFFALARKVLSPAAPVNRISSTFCIPYHTSYIHHHNEAQTEFRGCPGGRCARGRRDTSCHTRKGDFRYLEPGRPHSSGHYSREVHRAHTSPGCDITTCIEWKGYPWYVRQIREAIHARLTFLSPIQDWLRQDSGLPLPNHPLHPSP